MRVEITDKFGGQPVVLEFSQLLIRDDSGTPICVCGQYGPVRTVRVSHAQDSDFNASLRAFGYQGPSVVVESVTLGNKGVPQGAMLVGGPR